MRRLLLAATALTLGACSTLQPPAPVGDIQGTVGSRWQFDGKVGIRQGQRADSAGMEWQQDGEAFRIHLSGPLGQGGMQIEGNKEQVTLEIAGESEPYRGDSPEAVMQQALGWHLPVSQAQYWVQGRPAPHYPFKPLTGIQGFEQLGWHVEIQRTADITNSLTLPSKLEFTYADLRIRLVIRQWQTMAQ